MTKDYIIAIGLGFITALFALPILKNLEIELPFNNFFILLIIPVLWAIGIWLGAFLSRWVSFMRQFARFSVAGFLAAAIDFGILNFLMFATGLATGLPFTIFKSISFIVAASNSYFVNKFWTFHKSEKATYKEYLQFLAVSLVGISINVGIATLIVNGIGPQFGLQPKIWANLGAVAGSAIGLVWNFVGFKLIVFKA